MLYSILPPEIVLEPPPAWAAPPLREEPLGPGPDRLLLRPGPHGAVVERLVTTDPRRYLDPRLAPGTPYPPRAR